MTRLLVSVRSAEEALAALEGGAHLIDIKEPLRGALGAADGHIWQDVLRVVAGRVPVSAALGELVDDDCALRASRSQGFDYVKAGLAGCAADPNWRNRWAIVHRALPERVRLVAVIYADYQQAAAPLPDDVLAAACQLGLQTILIDTYDKSRGDLEASFAASELRQLLAKASAAGLQVALAGSLTHRSFPAALAYEPAWLAVRGAACEQGLRAGEVSAERVRQLVELLTPGIEITALSARR